MSLFCAIAAARLITTNHFRKRAAKSGYVRDATVLERWWYTVSMAMQRLQSTAVAVGMTIQQLLRVAVTANQAIHNPRHAVARYDNSTPATCHDRGAHQAQTSLGLGEIVCMLQARTDINAWLACMRGRTCECDGLAVVHRRVWSPIRKCSNHGQRFANLRAPELGCSSE